MRRFNVYPVDHQQGNEIEADDGRYVLHSDVADLTSLIVRDICEHEPDDTPESVHISIKALELILLQRLGVK